MANGGSTPGAGGPGAQPAPRLFSTQSARIAAALVEAESRLAQVGQDVHPARRAACEALLARTRGVMTNGRFGPNAAAAYLAWDCLQQFDREMVHLVSADERTAIWRSALAESKEKLSGHRLEAVNQIADGSKSGSLAPETVASVMKHLHTKAQNLHLNVDQLRLQIMWVGFFLLLVVVGVAGIARFGAFAKFSPTLDNTIMLGTLAGFLGGVLSVAFTVARTDERAKIPAVRSAFEIALVRPLLGAALALPVVLLVDAGVVSLPGVDKAYLGAIACFLAGFSERWFLGLVEGLERRETKAKGK